MVYWMFFDKFNELNKLEVGKACPYTPMIKVENRANINGDLEERIIIYMKSAGVAAESQEVYEYFEGEQEVMADKFIQSLEDPIETVEKYAAEVKPKKEIFRPIFLSENAVTLSEKMQLIMRFYGEPEEIHKNYDFIHTTNYYLFAEDKLVLNKEALSAILTKTLVYHGSLYPIASIFRTRKFIERGWRITAGQMLKMIFQLNKVDLSDRALLREQLIGVDASYMSQLLVELQQVEGKIDATYMAKLIDRIFE